MIGRAVLLGVIWGGVLGVVTYAVVCMAGADGIVAGLVWAVMVAPASAPVGGFIGGGLGLVAGLALAVSGRWVIRRRWLARLVTAGIAVALPLAFMIYLDRVSWMWDFFGPVFGPVGLIAVAAVTAVLLTPRIVNGAPPPRNGPVPMPPWSAP
jgi:hypothetical protein